MSLLSYRPDLPLISFGGGGLIDSSDFCFFLIAFLVSFLVSFVVCSVLIRFFSR